MFYHVFLVYVVFVWERIKFFQDQKDPEKKGKTPSYANKQFLSG
jgi:hypothetical protein